MAEPTLDLHAAALQSLPHSGPALLVHRVIESTADGMSCVGRFSHQSAMARDGRVPTYIGVEPAAQTAAAHLALLAMQTGRQVTRLEGFLTGVKNMTIARPWLPVEVDLVVRVQPRGGARGLYKYQFEIELDGAIACRGELSTFVKTDLRSPQ